MRCDEQFGNMQVLQGFQSSDRFKYTHSRFSDNRKNNLSETFSATVKRIIPFPLS